jgi:hypothetical protein
VNFESDQGGVVIRRNPRARRASLRVDPASGVVRVCLPPRASLRTAERLIADHRDWIARQRATVPPPAPFVAGGVVCFRGVPLRIEWDRAAARRPHVRDDTLLVGGPEEGLAGRIERWLRGEAMRLFADAAHALAAEAGLAVTSVRVGDPRSRWGSCSAGGVIALSWRLVMAPDWIWRAVVAHEVAHRGHMNHGPGFHALADRLSGDTDRPARSWLRANGAALQRAGS